MRLEHRRLFGLGDEFYKVGVDRGAESSFSDLSSAVCASGFDDYSPQGITSFLSFRYPILDHTMFAGFKVKRDSALGSLESSLHFSHKTPSFSKAAHIAEYLLLESIEKKVANARKIGIMLSGGLDSSLVVAMCRALYPHREIYTYSIGFYGDDEFKYARRVARKLANKHYEKTLGYRDFFGDNAWLKALIKQKAAPLHPNELPLAYAMTQARKDCCDVVLCGEGADDVFGGYSHNLLLYASYAGRAQEFYRYILEHYRYFSLAKSSALIREKYLVDDSAMIAPVFDSNAPQDPRDIMLYFIQVLHTRGLIQRGQNALRFCGFEDGFVFLDSRLIDFVNALPFAYKIHIEAPLQMPLKDYKNFSDTHCQAKFLLKQIAKAYLPSSIINREKKGFPVPFALWDKQKAFDIEVDSSVFKSDDLSCCNAWEKFMIYNLNAFVEVFEPYRRQTGGGGELSKDSACGLESWISSACCVDRPQVLSSLQALKSPDSSSTILESIISLESKAALESKKTAQSENPTASNSAPKNAQSLESKSKNKKPAKTSHTTLESKNLSLRAFEKGEAIHKQSLDSSAKADSMDCHEKSSDFSRNDKNNSADCHADKSARNDRKNSPCEKLDSSGNAPYPSSRAVCQHGEAIHTYKTQQTQVLESKCASPHASSYSLHTFLESKAKHKKQALESTFAKLDSSAILPTSKTKQQAQILAQHCYIAYPHHTPLQGVNNGYQSLLYEPLLGFSLYR